MPPPEPRRRVLLLMPQIPASTPQSLREESQRATRLAGGTTDEKAKAALLAYARELLERAAQLEAAAVVRAPVATTAQAGTEEVSKLEPED